MRPSKRVNTKIVLDWDGNVLERASFDYGGPWALCEEASGASGGDGDGSAGDGDKGGKKDPPAETVAKAEYDALKASFETLSGELGKLKKVAQKNSDDDRLKKGEHEKLLAEKTAALDDMAKKLEQMSGALDGYQKRDSKKADELLGSLPEDVQEKLKPLKGQMSAQAWLDLLELQSGMHAGAGGDDDAGGGDVDRKTTPPPTGSATGKGGKKGRELLPESKEILGSLMRNPEGTMTEKLTNRRSESKDAKGASAFTRSVESFFADMNGRKSEKMTAENANKRLA